MNATMIGVLAASALLMTTPPAYAQSDKEVQEVIRQFEKGDPGMQAWFREAYGDAVTSTRSARVRSGLEAPTARGWCTSAGP